MSSSPRTARLVPDLHKWTATILAYCKCGHNEKAIALYYKLCERAIQPDGHAFVAALKACGGAEAHVHGRVVHGHIVRTTSEGSIFVGNALVDMYIKCGYLEDACTIFNKMLMRDVVTWNTMIAGCCQLASLEMGLQLWQSMQHHGIEPDMVTYTCILKACFSAVVIEQGMMLHNHIFECSLEPDLFIGSSLIAMYAKSARLLDARRVFDRLTKHSHVVWNTIISGYVKNGDSWEALHLFEQMQHQRVEPRQTTFVCTVKACSVVASLHLGLIENGRPEEALSLFQKMMHEGINLNQGAFVSLLKACASTSALDNGKLSHAYAIDAGFESDVSLGNTLVDMYVNCGCVEDACTVFQKLPLRDFTSWTAMIAGFGHHNKYDMALHFFEVMQLEDLQPNDVTFICLLTICSHLGFVEEGCRLVRLIMEHHAAVLSVDHYNCLVDLLGRAKQLDRARDLLVSMPYHPTAIGWSSLLTHCGTHGMQDDANKIMEMKKGEEAWKEPGKALIEIGINIHSFVVGDNSHLYNDEIVARLRSLRVEMSEEGVFPYYRHHLIDN